jgi:hypothetical protein
MKQYKIGDFGIGNARVVMLADAKVEIEKARQEGIDTAWGKNGLDGIREKARAAVQRLVDPGYVNYYSAARAIETRYEWDNLDPERRDKAIAAMKQADVERLIVQLVLATDQNPRYGDSESFLDVCVAFFQVDVKEIQKTVRAELTTKGPKLTNISADGKAAAKKPKAKDPSGYLDLLDGRESA